MFPSCDEQAAVEQHAHRLDRVQRHAFGTYEDAFAQLLRQTGYEPSQELAHHLGCERLEVERGEAALASSPRRTPVHQLGAGQNEDEQGVTARPFEQVLEEVEQAGVRPLHVFENEDRRRSLCKPLEEDPPGREEILLIAGSALLEPEQVGETRLDPAPLLQVRDVQLDHRPQLHKRRGRLLVLEDAAAHPHHLRQRPVGHTLAVGQAAAPVPTDVLGQPVDVLLELPGEPGLADARDAGDRDDLRLPLLCRGVEELLHQTQLAVAADERRFQAEGLERASPPRGHPHRPEEREGLGLALELMQTRLLVGDCRLACSLRRLAHEHSSGPCNRLHARGRVDQIAGNHALLKTAGRDRRLTRQHARPCTKVWSAYLLSQLGHRLHEVEGAPHRPLGVVLPCDGSAPHRHHGISDELLHRSAVALDQPSARVEVAREQIANLLRVPRLRQRREADQIREQHRHQTTLSRLRLARLRRNRRGRSRQTSERRAALVAELPPRLIRSAAGGAERRQPRATLAAELRVGPVLGATVRADRHDKSLTPQHVH